MLLNWCQSGFLVDSFLPIEEVVSVNCSVVILLNVKVDHMCEMLVISTQVGRQLELKLRLRRSLGNGKRLATALLLLLMVAATTSTVAIAVLQALNSPLGVWRSGAERKPT